MPNVVFVHMFHTEIRIRNNAQFAHNFYIAVAHVMATSGAPFLSFPGELRIGQSAPAPPPFGVNIDRCIIVDGK
jgi:hypothetical protein